MLIRGLYGENLDSSTWNKEMSGGMCLTRSYLLVVVTSQGTNWSVAGHVWSRLYLMQVWPIWQVFSSQLNFCNIIVDFIYHRVKKYGKILLGLVWELNFSKVLIFSQREISSFSYGKIEISWKNEVLKLALRLIVIANKCGSKFSTTLLWPGRLT